MSDLTPKIDELLRGDVELSWRPELTAAVMAGVRRERVRTRWRVAVAAALMLAAAGLGGLVLVTGLATSGLGTEISATLPPTDTAWEAVSQAWFQVTALIGAALAPLDRVPRSPGLPLAIAAVILLLIVNGITLGRPALARRRNP